MPAEPPAARRPRSRRRWAMLPAALLLLIFLYILGCVPRPIRDLRLVEARRVPAGALPDREYRDALAGATLWRLTFEGDARWPEQVRRHELNGFAIAVRCDRRDMAVTTYGPFVGDVAIANSSDGLKRFSAGDAATLRYDVYLAESGRYHSQADFNAPRLPYHLGRERISLCVRIAGGAMHLAYGESNEVRVTIGR